MDVAEGVCSRREFGAGDGNRGEDNVAITPLKAGEELSWKLEG